ncbi:MAG: hypothetical protein GY722_05305 [bacterium]|nr:hypothetical protein [bacterium]
MGRMSRRVRERARELYLTGEVTSLSEIARQIKVKPHTVGRWRQDEDWDGLRLKIDRRAAEQLAERIATDRVNLNSQHFKLWGVVVSRLFESMQSTGLKGDEIRNLDKVAGILDRAQKGQRLARGLSLDGHTEEQIRAQAEADGRALVDLFIGIVKDEVPDEQIRDRVAQELLEACSQPIDEEHVG